MGIETNGDWLKGNGKQSANGPLSLSKPPIDDVDLLADELATEYDNQDYRAWYCRIIYKFGIERVRYWQRKAKDGYSPGKLFGYYARQAEAGGASASNIPSHEPAPSEQDAVYQPADEDLTDEGIERGLDEAIEKLERDGQL